MARPDPAWWEARAADLQLRKNGGELVGPCPACGGVDRFSVRLKDGVFHCRACEREGRDAMDIPKAAGHAKPAPPSDGKAQHGAHVAASVFGKAKGAAKRWTYRNTEGKPFDVVRIERRHGRRKQIRRDPAGVPPPYRPYGKPADDYAVIVEGEASADAVIAAGLPSLTWCGGAGAGGTAWKETDWTALKGRRVILWPDADKAGRATMHGLAAHLHGLGCRVDWIQPPPDVVRGWDAADTTAKEIRQLVASAKPWTPPESPGRLILTRRVDWADLSGLPALPADPLPGIPAQDVTVLGGAPGQGKSLLALLWAMAVATGEELPNGVRPHAPRPVPVLLMTLEETWLRVRYRMAALQAQYPQLQGTARLADTFILSTRGALKNWTAIDAHNAAEGAHAIEQEIKACGAKLAIMDTLSKFKIEESNEAFAALGSHLAIAAENQDCAIVAVHHLRKMPAGVDKEPDIGDLRGGSALAAEARACILLHWDGEAIKEIRDGKSNHAARDPGNNRRWETTGQSIPSQTGQPQEIAVLIPYTEKTLLDATPKQQETALKKALQQPIESRLAGPTAAGWFGYALAHELKLDIGEGYSMRELAKTTEGAMQANNRRTIRTLLARYCREKWLSKETFTTGNRNKSQAYAEGDGLPVN